MAYKGGHLEIDLLKELNIPTVNLEDLGCQKCELLTGQHGIDPIPDCGHHKRLARHCTMVECQAFWIFLTKQEKENWEKS